jgi:hypothetical protein
MANNRFSAFSATFTDAGGDLDLTQLGGQTVQPGMRRAMVRPGGSVDPLAFVNATADPRVQLTSRALLAILTDVSIATGMQCTSGASIRYQKRADAGGTFDAANEDTHMVLSSTGGFLWIDSIDVDIGSDQGAVANLSYMPYSSDGIADPLTAAVTNLTDQPVPAYLQVYFIGPAYVAGVPTLLPALSRLRINPGLAVEPIIEDGSVFPTGAVIRRRDPSFDLTFLKASMVASPFSHLFGQVQAAQIDVYLWKGDTATVSGRLAAAATSHIKLSAATSNWSPDDISVSAEDDVTVTVSVRSLGVLAQALGSAIP